MGGIISRFRKKKTSFELLQSLEDKIKEIEEYSSATEQKRKRVFGQLLFFTVGLYVIFGIFVYFYFPALSIKQKLYYLTPLVLLLILLILMKKVISWYYGRKLRSNQSKLAEMRKEKERLIEIIKDKESYNVATNIFEKFAPGLVPGKPLSVQRPSIQSSAIATTVRRRSNIPPGSNQTPLPITSTPSLQSTPKSSFAPILTPNVSTAAMNRTFQGKPVLALPAPILERNRTYMDRVVEYITGDGPANRYALICSQCHSHNGMALKEEFEYLGFRCCYCYFYNLARKQRPEAPALPSQLNLGLTDSESGDSDTTSSEEIAAAETDKLDMTAISSTPSKDYKELDRSDPSNNDPDGNEQESSFNEEVPMNDKESNVDVGADGHSLSVNSSVENREIKEVHESISVASVSEIECVPNAVEQEELQRENENEGDEGKVEDEVVEEETISKASIINSMELTSEMPQPSKDADVANIGDSNYEEEESKSKGENFVENISNNNNGIEREPISKTDLVLEKKINSNETSDPS